MLAGRGLRPGFVGLLMVISCFLLSGTSAAWDTDLLNLYINHNLSYSCMPYIRKEAVPLCDCMACSKDMPEFKRNMCKFFEEARKKGKADHLSPSLVNICTSTNVCPNIPNVCCNPSVPGSTHSKGCPICLPTIASTPSKRGQSPGCLLAEYEAASATKTKGADWKEMFAAFDAAMRKVKLHSKCASYALFKTAKGCDCEDCLQNETDLRTKWCRLGEEIRSNATLGRRGYMRHNDYLEKLCDTKACPSIPMKCCGDSTKNVDRKGCPTCIPTSDTFGFGPRCASAITSLPQNQKLALFNLP